MTGPGPAGDRRGMFGINGSGDTSGYGRLVRPVALAGSTTRPFGGYFDEITDRLTEVLGAEAVAAAEKAALASQPTIELKGLLR